MIPIVKNGIPGNERCCIFLKDNVNSSPGYADTGVSICIANTSMGILPERSIDANVPLMSRVFPEESGAFKST